MTARLTQTQVDGWNVASGGGESDPVFTGSPAQGVTNADMTNWRAAHTIFDSTDVPVAGTIGATEVTNWKAVHTAWTAFEGAGGTISGAVTVSDQSTIVLSANDPNGGIEIRSTTGGMPFLDFSNDGAVDYDARLRLTGDDTLALEGATLDISGIAGDNIAWMLQHGAANAACAPASPVWDSAAGHVVIPHESGKTSATSCSETTMATPTPRPAPTRSSAKG